MSTDLVVARPTDVLPSAGDFQTMLRLADAFYQSGLMPWHIKSAAAAFVVIQKGRELGIPPMQAIGGINVIGGKPACGAEVMLSLIYRDHGHEAMRYITPDARKNSEATYRYKRRGWTDYETYTYTLEQAKAAGLPDKKNKDGSENNWVRFPDAMLRARCISAVARIAFPDTIGGMYTPEELGASVEVRDGEVVVVEDAAPSQPVIEQSSSQPAGEASSGSASPAVDVRTSAPTKQQLGDRIAKACLALDVAVDVPLRLGDYVTVAKRYDMAPPERFGDLTVDYLTVLAENAERELRRKEYEQTIGACADLDTLEGVEFHVKNDAKRYLLTEPAYAILMDAIQTQRDALTPVEGEADDALAAFLEPVEA